MASDPKQAGEERETARANGRRWTGRDRPLFSGGTVLAALGIGIALSGLAVQGALSIDGSAALEMPRFLHGWLADGGLRISADARLSEPRLLFAGIGAVLLLIGCARILGDRSAGAARRLP